MLLLYLVAGIFPGFNLAPVQVQGTLDTFRDDPITTYVDCPLERIDTQLVRCDNLTAVESVRLFGSRNRNNSAFRSSIERTGFQCQSPALTQRI